MNPEYDELLVLAETLGEVKSKTEKLEAEFSTQARPLEAATNALSAALSGIKALQFHVLDNNLGALSARVEEMRKAVDEQVGVIALELKKADETNAAKAGQDAEALRSQIAALQAQLGTLGAQFSAQLERVEFSAKEEAKKLQLIPGPVGATGASLNPRGTFVDGETYNRLDVVSWLGSSYIAAVDGVTEKPSKNSNQWQVLASRGSGGSGGAGDFGSLAGVAQINQGGTGQTTRAAGLNALLPSQTGNVQYMLLTDGAGTVSWGAQPVAGLPSQTSNGGKLLTTDGTNASWSNAVTVSGSNATVTGTLTVNGTNPSSIPRLSLNSPVSETYNFGAIGTIQSADVSLEATSTAATGVGIGLVVRRTNGGEFARFINGAITTGLANMSCDAAGTYFSISSAVGMFLNSTKTMLTGGNVLIGGTTDIPGTGGLKVFGTTTSTSTSTGALVVGNGTSGGLGVGGAANIGGALTTNGNVTINSNVGFIGKSGIGTGGNWRFVSDDGISRWQTGVLGGAGETSYSIYDSVNTRSLLTATAAGVVQINQTTASTSTSSGALVVSGGVGVAKEAYVGKTCVVGAGSDNASYVNVYTNKVENTAGPFDITLPSDCVGVVFLNSWQSGVGRSFREIPFICFGGTVTLGTSRTTVLTSDPVTSAVAAASSKITVSLVAANTNCYWGIYVNKSY